MSLIIREALENVANQLDFFEELLPGTQDVIKGQVWQEAGYWKAAVAGFWFVAVGATRAAAIKSLINNILTESRAYEWGYP